MKRFFKWIFKIILVLIIVGILAFFLPLKIKDTYLKDIYQFYFDKITEDIPFSFVLNKPEIIDGYVTEDENYYYLNIEVAHIKADEITAIYINNVKYTNFKTNQEETLTIVIPLDLTFNEEEILKSLAVNKIEINNKVFTTTLVVIAHKTIDNNIISSVKESIVAIETTKRGFFSQSKTWGSGVVFKEVVRFVGGNKPIYEYYILTNYHVVRDGENHTVYYKNLESKINAYNVDLIKYYYEDADLAIIKVTLNEPLLKPLNDQQFITYEPLEVTIGQAVFAIGSPSVNGEYDFNQVKIGEVTKLSEKVKLTNEQTICKHGCNALQTNAIQGEGSSGGGVFDRDGNMIGLHFAGDKDNKISSEIPMSAILKFIKETFEELNLEGYLNYQNHNILVEKRFSYSY